MNKAEAKNYLDKERVFHVHFMEHRDVAAVEAADYEIPFPGAVVFFDNLGRKTRSWTTDVFTVVPAAEKSDE